MLSPTRVWKSEEPLQADYTARVSCKIYLDIYIKLLHPHCSRARRAKIDLLSMSDADRAARPASPISSLVYRSRYPSAISSLVIPTWVTKTNKVSGGNAPNL